MQSKNNATQGLFREMSSKTIKSPQVERISSLDSGRPPVMIFTSRGKVARKSLNSRVFETLGEEILSGRIETKNLNRQFDKESPENNKHVNGKVTANGVSPGSLVASTETISKLRRPAPPAPVSSQAAPATDTSLVSSRALSLSSSLQSLNNRRSLESDSKVQPPLIPAPKTFIQRQSSLSSSTSSLSSPQTSPTSQLHQPTMTTRPITIDLTLPTPPPDANNNREDIFQVSLTDKEYQQASQFSSAKKIRAPEPPNLPSPPPPPSPPPHTSPHSPLPSPLSSPSSSSASSSPLNRFRFPPPPSTPPSPMEIPDVHTSFTNTSVSSPGLLTSQTDRDRKRTLSPNEVMDYFDEAIGDQTVSASTYNEASGFSQFSPVFHFPSVSDDKQPEQRPTETETHTQIPGNVGIGSRVESTETATSISTVYSSKDRNEETSGDFLHAEFSSSEKTSEENSAQNQLDNSPLSPQSEEERKRRGNAASKTVAVSKLLPEVKTVRQHIKPGTVDELASLFANMKDELITSPTNKGDFDFNIRQTLEKLESLDKSAESKSPVLRNAKRATILSASELFPRLQSSASAESLQGRPRSLHSPAYSKVNQWPRLYQASSTNTLYTPPDLPDPKATAGFDFLAASREIHKHVVLIRSNSRAESTAPSKVNDVIDESSKIHDRVSNFAHEPSNRNTSPINSQERHSHLTEDTTEETFNRAEESLVAGTMTPMTEVGRMDISRTDSAMVTGESLRDAAGSFDATIESQFISEFPHPTITPTNSRNSSRRSSIEDKRKSETEHVSLDATLIKTSIFSEVKRLARSQSSTRSHSPDRPSSSRNSSRRSSTEVERQKEDTDNYSARAELEGTLSSVVTKLHTGSRSSSRSTSPDRSTRSPNSSRRSSIEVERQKEDTSNYSASVELEGTLSSVVDRRHTSSQSSSRSNSPDRKLEVGGTHALTAATTSFVSGRSRSRSSSVKSESKAELISQNLNNSSRSSTSPANSKSSSRAGSVRHGVGVDEESTDNSGVVVENNIVSNVAASFSSSSDTNNRTVDMLGRQASLDDHSNASFDGLLSYSKNISSFDSNSIQAEHRIAESHDVISEDHQNTTVRTNLSAHSSRSSSRSGSLEIRGFKDEVNLELPQFNVDTVAVSTADHTRSISNSSSRSSSLEKRSTEVHIVDKVFSKAESISSSSRKSSQSESQEVNYGKLIQDDYETTTRLDYTSPTSSQTDEERRFSDQTTNEHQGHEIVLPISAGSISSRSSRSGSFKIRDTTDEVHMELSSSALLNTAAVYGANIRSSSSGSSSPHMKVSSEDISQSYDKAFVSRITSASSTPGSSGEDSSLALTAGDVERETNVETSLTHLDHLKTDWDGFLKTETKSKEESTAAFIVDIENTHPARANISPSSSKSSSRDGSKERNNTDDRTTMESKTASSTQSSSRSSSRAGSVLNNVGGHDSESFHTALIDSFGFTVKPTTSSSSSKSLSNSVNRDNNHEFYLNDQNEASNNLAFSSISFYSNNRTDDDKDLDHKLLNENYATEFVTSARSSRLNSPTMIDSSATLQKEQDDTNLGKVSVSTSPAGSQKSSRDSSPDRNKSSVEYSFLHTDVFGNIATSTFAARKSPASSRRSSDASSVIEGIQPRTGQDETHTFSKRSTSSSNSPASGRRSNGSHEAESADVYQQLHIDNLDVQKIEETDSITVNDTSSEIKSQPHEEASHASVNIINSADMSSRMSPLGSRRNSLTGYLHYQKNQKGDAASIAPKSSSSIKNQSSSSSSFTTTPAGSRRTSRDVDSVKDIELDNNKPTSDLTTTSNVHADSVTGMYVLTRSGDSSPDGSLKRAGTWGGQETDSYQLALQSALESTTMASISDSRKGSPASFVKRGSDTNHSSSSSSKHSSRSASPTRIAGSDLKADNFNVSLDNTFVTSSVNNNVSSANYTKEISNITSSAFTKSEQEVDDAYNTSLSNTENLGKATTSPIEHMSYTLKDEAPSARGYSDTLGSSATPSETRVNITEGKQLDFYYTEVGSKHLPDSQLKDTHRSETFLPPPPVEILASNFGSYVNLSEKENISNADSMFHLASFNSNDTYHSEVNQSLKDAGVGRSSFSASADMYSQQHLAGDGDEVARINHVNHNDYSSDDGKLLRDTDDTPVVEYGHTVADIHIHDREDTISQISTMSQFGSDKDRAVDIPDNSSSSDSDNSSSHKSSRDEYTVNEAPDDDSSAVNAKINVYSFSDFKQGIAHTSSSQLSSSHDQHKDSAPEVITKGYETVIVASSEKDTGRGSRKSSSSGSDVSSSHKKEILASETLQYDDEYGIYENMGRRSHVLTRQENVAGQLPEVAYEQTDEPLRSLTADHINIVYQSELSSGLGEENENADVVELRSHKVTEEARTNVFAMQLVAETDASTSTIPVEPATPGVHGDMEVAVTPATDHSRSSLPKDFLSVLDDINIETDITSAFLRRSSRFSGTYSPARRQSRSDSGEGTAQTNTGVVRDSATETTLSSTSFILRDYQAKDTAHTTDAGSQEPVSGVSVGKDVMNTDITFSHFVSELKEGTDENKDVSHSETSSLTMNDRMHNEFDGASHDSVIRKEDNDLKMDFYTDTDDVSRKISVEEIIHSTVRNTEESHTGRFDLSAEMDATLSSGNDTELSHSVHKTRTEVVDPTYIVADVNFSNKTEGMYVNEDLTSPAGETGVYGHDKEDQIVALHGDNSLQTEYVNDNADELSESETVKDKKDLDGEEDREHVHSYINDIIHHSVDTVSTEDTDTSNHVRNWKSDDREDKQQVHSYVSDIIHHSVDTISTEDTDKFNPVHDWKADVKEDKQQLHSYVSGIIEHSVDTISTEDTDKFNRGDDCNVDVKEDKQQVHSYVSDIIHHSVDTISTEDTDKFNHVHDGDVDDREDKQHVHSYVSDIIHHSVDTISTEDTGKFDHVHDWKADVREDKQQLHSYDSGIIQHSVDTISTYDTDRNNVATDWKIETDSTDIYNKEAVSGMKILIPETTETHVQEVEMDSRVTANEISGSLDMPLDELTLERRARADIHTYTNTIDETSQSYPEHGFGENTVYESFDHMEATKSSSDAHLHFSGVNISKEHEMQRDASPDILDHHVDKFSVETLKEEGHVDQHVEKASINAYVGDIINNSVHTVDAGSAESTGLVIHQDQVTPSHFYENHSVQHAAGEPDKQSHTTAFEHHFNVDSKYVNTSNDHDPSNDGHSSQLNIVVNNLFNRSEVTNTALLPSNMYDSLVENNDDDNKEKTVVVYEEMQYKDMHQTKAPTHGLHKFNDDLEARATDNEDIHPHIISGLESTNVHHGVHASHETVQTSFGDQDDFISQKYLLNESRDAHTNKVLHQLTDDMNMDTVRREDHAFEINKQNESNEAYIGETAFDFLNESDAEEHPPTSMQDKDATVNKYVEATQDTLDSVSEFNIEASRHEDLQTVISSVSQYEKVIVNDIDKVHGHHLPEVSIEETNIKSNDVLHKNMARESPYIKDSNEVPSKIHKTYQVSAEIDLDEEIRKQHQILSPKLNEYDGYEKAPTFSPDISSSRSSSIDSSQTGNLLATTRETAFNSEFFVRSRSSSDDGNHELSRQYSGLVTAASPLFLHEDNDNDSLAELQHKEHLDTVEEFTRTLYINNERSMSSRSSVDSDKSGHQTHVTSDSFRLDNAVDTEKQRSLPSTDFPIVEDNSFHKNIKLEYERLNSVEESDADFKSVKQTTEESVSVARLSQTLQHSVSNDDDSAKQKEDESHLFSKDKFQALRNVFEKQVTMPETDSFKTKRSSYKLGTASNLTTESLHGRNWELNRQVSSGSSVTSTSKKEMHGHLTSAAQIEDCTSIESDSDRVMTKWSGSDRANNQNMQDQVHKNMDLNKKLSYDLQTRQLRRGSASSLSSASSEDSTKHNHGEGHSSNFTADEHYPKNNLFSQKPGLINMTQWNTQSTYGNDSELAETKRRSSVSSDLSSASQKEVAGHITADSHTSIQKEKSLELHSFSDTDQNQLLEIPGEVTNPLFSDTSSTDDEEPHSLSDTNQNQLLEIPGELRNPLFADTSSTDGGKKLEFRKRANSSNSLSSDESSSLEIEDHSLFSQEAVGRFSPSGDQETTHIEASFVRDTNNRNSDKSSVRSQSTLRSGLGGVNDSNSPSDTNFSFRKNNSVITNTAESPTDHVKPQVAQQHHSQSSDRGAAVRRHSSSGSEKEAKLIGAFLRSNVRSPLNRSFSNISHHSSETGNVKSHHYAEPDRHADVIDANQSNRRASSSSDSSVSVKGHLTRPADSAHSEISVAEEYKNEARNYEDLTSVIDPNSQKHTFQSEEAFTVVSHNFSQPTLRRDSLLSQEDTNKSHMYLTPEEQNVFRSRSENGDSPFNFDDRPAVKTYVIKRSMANDVYVEPNEYLHENVFSNSRPGVTHNSSRDFYTSSSAVPVSAAREAKETYSKTQEPTRQWQWQSSQLGVDSFNQGITSKKENLSLEHDWGYRDKIDSQVRHDGGEKRYEIKRTGLDFSPIFPSLLSRDTSVQETNRYTAVSHDRDIFNEGYTSPLGLYDGHGYSSSRVPVTQYAEKENVLRLQSRAPNVVDTTSFVEKSATGPGANSTTVLGNRQGPIGDRFQFTPITISTASQAVVGNKVGVHIDFSPPGAPHSLHDISSSSDEESNRQRFVVKNVQQTSLLKNNLNNSSEIIFAEEDATTENVNRITKASGSLSPRTVVDGPIFRTYQSQRSHLSRSFSSDNSLASPLEYNNDTSPQVYDPVVTNNHSGDENGHLYQVLSVSSNGPELSKSETERGRSRNRSRDFSGTKNQSTTPRKQHHSPERFFKNPKLSLRQEDYDNKGYSSDDEEGKQYQHVTKVYLSGETPRSRSQSPGTNYRVSSLKSQNGLEDRSNVRSSSNVRNGSPEISDNDSHSRFQGHQQRYKVIGTSDNSLDTHKVRAHSSPKLGRKQENYFQENAITRTQTDHPSQLKNASADRQTHKSVVQLEVGSNYITEKRRPEDIQDSRYVIKRVRSVDDLRDTFADSEDAQASSDRKMWKTGRSRSTDRFLSGGDAVDGEFEPTGLYDPTRSFVSKTHMDNKMYVINKTVSNRRGSGGNPSTPHGWYTSKIDLNERGPTRIPSHDDKIHSQNYKTEKTLYLSNTASPPPNTGHALERTREFVFHEYGQGAEINNSDGGNEHHEKAERFERFNEEMVEPHDLDYTRSTEDLSNDLRVLRGKILIKNRFDSAEFSEDDFDQNANLFDTSFHLGKDNPVYSSDQDITASLRREEERDLSKHVTQDITFETVDRLAQQYKADRQVQLSPGPQRKKPNLSSLLLSKLALVDSKDIRQTVDVEHHNEEIHGDIRFVHADGEQKPSKDTYNFDSVNEKVELTLTQGKANVIIKVIAERVVPTDAEFNTWRKSQAIVTRHIEIDLQANEQMKRLYKHVMSKTGNSGALDGSGRLSSYNSASLSVKDREMSSMETLKLFTQILDVAEQQSNRDNTDSRVRHDLGQLPASVMDMLY